MRRPFSYINDDDSDGVLDYQDGIDVPNAAEGPGAVINAQEDDFTPLVLTLSSDVDLATAKIQIDYSDFGPTSSLLFDDGHMRIWTKPGNVTRLGSAVQDFGDFVAAGEYSPSQLGFTAQNLSRTFYLEGIHPTVTDEDRTITASIDPDGAGPEGYTEEDVVRVSVIYLDLDVDGDGSLGGQDDGAFYYLPGYQGDTAMVSTGAIFNTVAYQGQHMKIVAEGIGTGQGVDSVVFSILDTTNFAGYTGNASDSKIEGTSKDDDYSFKELTDDLTENGTMEADNTWVDFWAKDYGGRATVQMTLKDDQGNTIFTSTLVAPLDADSDNIADKWERDEVANWNAQFGVSETVGNNFFSSNDDKELRDPDGNTNALTFTGGTNMGNHNAAGDGRTVAQEYRGYILDGGGHDWNGQNAHQGGHVRLNPAYKEWLLEVDAMTGVTNMPNRAGIKAWMDAVAIGTSQAVDGAGFRTFYILQNLATVNNLFAGANQVTQVRTYVSSNAHTDLTSFKHLHLVDHFAGQSTSGWSWVDVGATYAVDQGTVFANGFGTIHTPYISHELFHIVTSGQSAGSDGGGHSSDTNGNGTNGDGIDKLQVLWNYNFNYSSQAKTLTVAMAIGDVTLTLNNTTNLSTRGRILIGTEIISYTGINGNQLTGLVRGIAGTAAAAHGVGSATPQYSAEEMKQIMYGAGTMQHVLIR